MKICDFDFSGKTVIPMKEKFVKQFRFAVTAQANAIFFWWDLRMNPSGDILLSCAPHWSHPDTDALAQSKDEVIRRNAIPWRDHWMQGCFYVKSRLTLTKGSCAFVTTCHDEFSWWFDISYKYDDSLSIDRPLCSCFFHMVNSRNRIMQINDHSKLTFYHPHFDRMSGKHIVFTGDHNLLALVAASMQRDSSIYLLQDDPLCRRSVENFIAGNVLGKRIQLIGKLNDVKNYRITHFVAEPHYNNAILPWDNMTRFWQQINELKNQQKEDFVAIPASASIHAVPVNFLNLHKIRWPLRSTCEGFNHQIFDNVIEISSSLADENVEPFSLWEYPCVALGPSIKIFDLNFRDDIIKGAESTIKIEDSSKACNGIAFWVEWNVDKNSNISCGPLGEIFPGELVNWKMSERQGVHLIPSSKIDEGKIDGIRVKIRYELNEERLAMVFTYCYQS